MKKTFMTKMPDHAGALLKASQIITRYNANIGRISYNKMVDTHTLFLDITASEEDICNITNELALLGYFQEEEDNAVILIELRLHDVPGILQGILEVLARHGVNISYISSTQESSEYQRFRMGLFIENPSKVKQTLDDISLLCEVKTIDYTVTEKLLDSTVFYLRFATEMRKILSLTQEETNELIISSNQIMHILEARNELPQKTFEFIKKFASFVANHKGKNFTATVHQHKVTNTILLYLIDPPCGSNIYIFHNSQTDELLFIDGGFSCFVEEVRFILQKLFPQFSTMPKALVLTHGDMDHTGIAAMVDCIYTSHDTYENFRLESEGKHNFREQNQLHGPYCRISRIITQYTRPDLEKMCIVGKKTDENILSFIGTFSFAGLDFSMYQGNGGHVQGESIIVCETHSLIFTGDNLVNIKGFSKEQQTFNILAPYLMSSVNMDSAKASLCRRELLQRFTNHMICPGHGIWFSL